MRIVAAPTKAASLPRVVGVPSGGVSDSQDSSATAASEQRGLRRTSRALRALGCNPSSLTLARFSLEPPVLGGAVRGSARKGLSSVRGSSQPSRRQDSIVPVGKSGKGGGQLALPLA